MTKMENRDAALSLFAWLVAVPLILLVIAAGAHAASWFIYWEVNLDIDWIYIRIAIVIGVVVGVAMWAKEVSSNEDDDESGI